MTLDGQVVMTIPASAIPDEFKIRNARSGQLALALTGLDVAPNGDLYVTDGYASDYIHRFDRTGKYLKSFGGKKAPYNFSTLHKLAIDTRFQPARIIACDRANNRVVHLSLDGDFLGVVAKDLLLPAAVPISGDYAIIGELQGQVSVLDKSGRSSARLGTNTDAGVGTQSAQARAVAAGHRRVAARRRGQRSRRPLRVGVQPVRPRAPVQPAVGRLCCHSTVSYSRSPSPRKRRPPAWRRPGRCGRPSSRPIPCRDGSIREPVRSPDRLPISLAISRDASTCRSRSTAAAQYRPRSSSASRTIRPTSVSSPSKRRAPRRSSSPNRTRWSRAPTSSATIHRFETTADIDRAGVTVAAAKGSEPGDLRQRAHQASPRRGPAGDPGSQRDRGRCLTSGKIDAFAANRQRMEEAARTSHTACASARQLS